jgi:hypothetical protein
MPEKNAAAVEMGKRRQAKMTAEERAAFAAARDLANAKRSPIERRAIARKAARTRRECPKWIRKAAADSPGEPAPVVDTAAQLDRALDEIPDDLLERLASALVRPQV